MKRNYDVKTLVLTYNEGDVIYVLDTASFKGKCRKPSPTWKGPGIFIEKLTDHTYRIRLRGKITTVNHDRIKLCNDRHVPEWIRKYKKDMVCSVTTGIYCLCFVPDPAIIERTIGLVLGPFTALYRSFLKRCTLTNKAVGTIWRALSKPPQRRQGPDPRPLWLLVGTPSAFGPELAYRLRVA